MQVSDSNNFLKIKDRTFNQINYSPLYILPIYQSSMLYPIYKYILNKIYFYFINQIYLDVNNARNINLL